MVLIRVQYDAYNKRFTVLNGEVTSSLEDGETYMLIADLSIKDLTANESGEIQSELIPVQLLARDAQ